jgi:hypothetical protein
MSGLLTQLKVAPDAQHGLKLCEGHILQLNTPFIIDAVNPTISGGNAVTDAIRTMITAGAAPITTGITTAVGATASILSLVKVGNTFYLKPPCY